MTIKEVMLKYHKKVTFPLTPRKIQAAGYNVADYLINILDELKLCSDADTKTAQKVIRSLIQVKNLTT